jgi:GTP-binding protein
VPNLGVVALSDDRSFVVADVPGLIEGAHTGHGLGHQFLRHLERTKLLVHLVDVSSTEGRDPVHDFEVIERELALFHGRQYIADEGEGDPRLGDKPRIVAATKMDVLEDPTRLERLRTAVAERGLPFTAVSAVTGDGVSALLEQIWPYLMAARTIDHGPAPETGAHSAPASPTDAAGTTGAPGSGLLP